WSSAGPWVVRALLSIPAVSPTVTASEGSATVSTWLAGAALDWRLTAARSPWGAALGAGVAATLVRVHGQATQPFLGTSADLPGALPFVEASASRALWESSPIRLGVQAMAGADLPRPVVRFAGREVAALGAPLLAGSLLVEVDAP